MAFRVKENLNQMKIMQTEAHQDSDEDDDDFNFEMPGFGKSK